MENGYGASTSCACTFDNVGILIFVEDTSTHETNYCWDGWCELPELGSTVEEVDEFFSHLFDEWSDEFRHPYVICG